MESTNLSNVEDLCVTLKKQADNFHFHEWKCTEIM